MTAPAPIITPDTIDTVPNSAEALAALRRNAAIKLLSGRLKRMDDLEIPACRKKHAGILTEATKAQTEAIDKPLPSTAKELRAWGDSVKAATAEIRKREKEKKDELDELTSERKMTEQAFIETIESEETGLQQGLDFGDKTAVADGLALTPGTLERIDAEARQILAAKGTGSAPVAIAELATAIAGLGISGATLVKAASDDVEEDAEAKAEETDADAEGEDAKDIPF